MGVAFAALFALSTFAANDDALFNGKWNIAVNGDTPRTRAWWLEVTGAGTDALKGRFVGAPGGDLDDIPKISIFDGELRFVFDRRYRKDSRVSQKGLYWARLENGKLKGTFEIEGDPATYLEWSGVRPPVLPDKDDGTWKRGDPVQLFDGKDVSGWLPLSPAKAHNWTVKDGVLMNAPTSSDIVSDKKFWNFDLHVEYMVAPHSNSGVGLRGRYEIQILDDFGDPPSKHGNGALYGRIAPKLNVSKMPGEWQTLDLRLIGRQFSEMLNGTKLFDKATIDGPTAIAQDINEADPGPITLQGDHGPVQFRKVTIYPLTSVPAPPPAQATAPQPPTKAR